MLLEVFQAAHRLHVNPQTVWRLLRAKKLPGIRLGNNRWRIDSQDLQAFIQAHRVFPEKSRFT